MPAKSTLLHEFVRSMTPAEIRAFKHYCAYQKGEKEYLLLFDLLRKMSTYDESKIEKVLAGKKILNNLSRTKDYLYDLIVRGLAVYYGERGANLNLIQREIEVELAREHHDNALKLIRKAKALAKSEERFEVWLSVLAQERKILIGNVSDKRFEESLSQNAEELEHAKRLLTNFLAYQELENEVINRQRSAYLQNGIRDNELIRSLAENPLMNALSDAKTIRAKQKFFKIAFEIAKARGVTDKAIAWLEQELDLFEANEFLRENDLPAYYNTLFLRSVFHQLLQEFPQASKLIQRLKTFAKNDSRHRQVLFERIVMAELTYGYATDDQTVVQAATTAMEKHPDRLEAVRLEIRLLLIWYRARIAFKDGQFQEGIRWLRSILDLKRTPVRKDLQISARILHCIGLFELGEWEQLHHFAASYARFLRKHAREYAYEAVIVDALRKLPSQKTNAAVVEFLKNLLSELENAFEERNEQYALHYYDLPDWIRSKIDQGKFF